MPISDETILDKSEAGAAYDDKSSTREKGQDVLNDNDPSEREKSQDVFNDEDNHDIRYKTLSWQVRF